MCRIWWIEMTPFEAGSLPSLNANSEVNFRNVKDHGNYIIKCCHCPGEDPEGQEHKRLAWNNTSKIRTMSVWWWASNRRPITCQFSYVSWLTFLSIFHSFHERVTPLFKNLMFLYSFSIDGLIYCTVKKNEVSCLAQLITSLFIYLYIGLCT